MKPPPTHRPGIPRTLDRQFAADPFDLRMRGFDRNHTSIGLLIEIWQWCRTHNMPPDLVPVMNSVREHLKRECPGAVAELEKISAKL